MTPLLLLLACTDGEAPPDPSTAETGDTGTWVVDGPCAPTDNALRFACEVPGGGLLRWWPADDPSDVREASGVVVTVYGLRPDVDTVLAYPDGTEAMLRTGPLPTTLQGVGTQLEGGGIGTWVLTTGVCNGRELVVLDGKGRPRWYVEHDRKVLGIDVTPQGTVLAMLGGGLLVEYDATGAQIWTAQNETGKPIHHDLARDAQGYTYTLAATTYEVRGVDYIVDQLLVFDPSGAHVDTWELFDHLPDVYTPTDNNGYWMVQFPGAIDFTHGNSVEVSPDGSLVVSLRWLDTVVVLEGDPTSPRFGTPRWWLSADGSVPPELTDADDLVLTGEAFDGQHHASVDADGVLRLFDNRVMPEASRALSYRIDGSTAVHDGTWELPKHCPIQGSAYPLDDGSMLLTCATSRRIERFAPGGPSIGSTDLSCTSGSGSPIARAIPIDW
jgi:hypothetical protein